MDAVRQLQQAAVRRSRAEQRGGEGVGIEGGEAVREGVVVVVVGGAGVDGVVEAEEGASRGREEEKGVAK